MAVLTRQVKVEGKRIIFSLQKEKRPANFTLTKVYLMQERQIKNIRSIFSRRAILSLLLASLSIFLICS